MHFLDKDSHWGRCPALTPLLQLITQAGHRVPLTMCNPWMTCCGLTLIVPALIKKIFGSNFIF